MQHDHNHSHCHPSKDRPDFVLWGSLAVISLGCLYYGILHFINPLEGTVPGFLAGFSTSVVELLITMSWGLLFAIGVVGVMELIPKAKFHQILGTQKGVQGILRATLAGVVLDLCSHGILLVGMKLYERGVSLGQVVAFLVASPWNSFSMTLILWSLIGFKLTLVFILVSALIAIFTGLVFDLLVNRGALPKNPHSQGMDSNQDVPWFVIPKEYRGFRLIKKLFKDSLHESKMILRWIFFGIILTAIVKEVISPENFEHFFGPNLTGVILTLVAATVLEVCSEGSAPLAAELVTTAGAPGNGFSFLMAGVSTDYTEILALKETTRSWKVALFLPLITLPQIVIIGVLLNWMG